MCRPSETSDSSPDKQLDHGLDGDGGRQSNSSSLSSNPTREVSLVFLVSVLTVAVVSSFSCGYYYQTSINGNISYSSESSLKTALFFLLGGKGRSDSMTLSTYHDLRDNNLSLPTRNMSSFILLDAEDRDVGIVEEEVAADYDDDAVDDEEEEDGAGAVFALAGHVLIDFNSIQSESIDTKDKLFKVMANIIKALMFELQSYHCHQHEAQPTRTYTAASKQNTVIPVSVPPPRGTDTIVQCVGILSDGDGHVSIYAWPNKVNGGRVFMDAFLTELEDDDDDEEEDDTPTRPIGTTKHMLPELALLESKIVGVLNDIRIPPTSKDDIHDFVLKNVLKQLPYSTDSALRIRGKLDLGNVKNTDIEHESATIGVHQTVLASVETDFQKIEIIDEADQWVQNDVAHAMEVDPQYLRDNVNLFLPDRAMYMDGIVQSRYAYDAAYHETLVHPGMFQHPNPKRVAIIGGGEGATLREVLKHNTVEEVVMIDIDPAIVELSRIHLQDWSDCAFLQDSSIKDSSSTSCFDNERATVYAEDAIKWFMDRFLVDEPVESGKYPKFDLIIMDALDPQEAVEFAGVLYNSNDFVSSLYNALSDDGILVSQVGDATTMNDADDTHSYQRNRVLLERCLADVGFERIKHYDGAGLGFEWPWSFYVSLKSHSREWFWYSSEARIMYEMQKRSIPSIEGESPFHFFDGATMLAFRFPHKSREVVFCRRNPTPEACESTGHGFDPYQPNVPLTSLEVKKSGAGENAGYGLYSKFDIPVLSYLGLESSVHIVIFEADTHELVTSFDDAGDNDVPLNAGIADILAYLWGYGFTQRPYGKEQTTVDSTMLTFVNHGCNGTANVGFASNVTEFTANIDGDIPDELVEFVDKASNMDYVFDPYGDRDTSYAYGTTTETNRPIAAGEEILDNYLDMVGDANDWAEDVVALREMCTGLMGLVEIERAKKRRDNEEL